MKGAEVVGGPMTCVQATEWGSVKMTHTKQAKQVQAG